MPSLHQVFAASAILLALPLSQNVLTNAYPSAWRPQPQVYNEDAMLSVPHEDPLPALLLSRDVPAVVVDINEREANPAPKPDATEDKRAARPQATEPSIGDKAGHGGGKREADPAPRPDATEGKRAAGPQPTEDPAIGDKAGHGGGKREADPAPRPDATEGKRAAGPQPTEDPATGDKAGHGGGKREAEPLPKSDAIEGKRAAEPESTQ